MRSTDGLRVAAFVPFVLLSTASLALLHRIALRMNGSRAVALLAASLYAVHGIPLGCGSTTFPRTAPTTCVLAAFLLLQSRRASLALPAAAGAFLATALFSTGVYDGLRTGRPFSSLFAFATFALLEGKPSSLEAAQPLWWYLWRVPKWFPLPLVPFAFARDRRPRNTLAAMVLVPFGLLSLVHHKELRYLLGVIPFLCLLLAAGACRLFSPGHRKTTIVLLVSSLPWLSGELTFRAHVEGGRRSEPTHRDGTGSLVRGSVAAVGLRGEPLPASGSRRPGPLRAAHARGAGASRPGV